MMQNKKIILASASPRRKELMQMAGYTFEVQVSHKEEVYKATAPDEIVKELALLKANDIAEQNEQRNLVVIGADTVVAHKGAILGKPESKEAAFDMFQGFQGDRHQVYTGVAIISFDEQGKKTVVNHAVKTEVYVNSMTDEEIWAYIESDNVMDKAGSYGIQGNGCVLVKGIEGDYFNVVGFPVSRFCRELKAFA
jgi:septum formation protein